MDIREINIDQLIPYSNNPRHNDSAVEAVVNSIKEFGFKVPIVVDKNNVIVAGHTRIKAAKKLGMEQVPCVIADDLTPSQVKAFRLADNKVAELATWNLEMLEQELDELAELDIDMTGLGFEFKPDAEEDDFDPDEVLGEMEVPGTNPGDIYILGRHRLLCGDSTKKKDFSNLLKGDKVKLVITDPPYNVDYEGGTGLKIMNDAMSDTKFRAFLTDAYKRMYEAAEPGAPIYIFHADSEGYNFRGAFKDAGFKLAQCLIWVKQSLVLGRQDYHWRHEPILYGWKEGAAHFWYGERNKDTVIDDEKINYTKAKKADLIQALKDMHEKMYKNSSVIYHDKPSRSSEHPTMKPVKLIGKLMNNSSERGDTVLDPFGGSGSTLIAAEQLERTCYIVEMDPKYCDVIVKRWEEFTGEKAVKL